MSSAPRTQRPLALCMWAREASLFGGAYSARGRGRFQAGGAVQVEGELVSRKRLEDLAPEQFSSILILADESATFSTADADQASPTHPVPRLWV